MEYNSGTGHKMQSISVVFSTLHCEGYIADFRYRWLITSGSARWLIEILSAILKSMRTIAFWETTRSPAFTMHKFYERKFNSEYLERQFYERFLKSEPSIEKLIENKTHICVNLDFYSGISSCERQTFDMMKSQLSFVDSVYS